MRKKFLFIAAIIILIIAGCNSPKKIFNSNSNGWLPADFNPKTGVLLIQSAWPDKQQNKIEKFMKETYPYKYEFVGSRNSIDSNSKYSDKNTCRFILANAWSSKTMNYMQPNQIDVHTCDYNFIDRLNNKNYPASGIAASYPSMVLEPIITKILKDKP